MKKIQTIIFLVSFLSISHFTFCQQSDKELLKRLEDAEREAILKADTVALSQLWDPQILVHNPENKIVNFEQIKERIRSGKINYSSFERIIEKMEIVGNVGIVMGKEIINPAGNTTNPGKTVTRRFTNIWIKNRDVWKLLARQATIISVN
ncbi:MAG: nuclear transport factor 2 family protein [Ferruginibacter sp.]